MKMVNFEYALGGCKVIFRDESKDLDISSLVDMFCRLLPASGFSEETVKQYIDNHGVWEGNVAVL